jgi:hypothetical protein
MAKRKNRRTNIYLQSIHIKLKIEYNANPPKTGGKRRCSGRVDSSCSASDHIKVQIVQGANDLTVFFIVIFYSNEP